MPRPRAFTLIEVLVVIAVVSLIVGILLPALGSARTTARQTLSLSNVRSIGQTFGLYTDANGTYPFPGTVPGVDANLPEDIYSFRWYPEGTILATNQIWAMDRLWPGLVSSVTPWTEAYTTWVSPGRDKSLPTFESIFDGVEPREVVSYEFSNSFLASGRNWTAGATQDRKLLVPTRPDEVTYTAQKVLLWDRHLTYQTDQPEIVEGHYDELTPMAFADLHGDVRNPLEAQPGVPNPNNETDIRRLHNTKNGVRGIDY